MKGLTGAILITVLVFAGPACAEFYKYLDKQGVVRFTDDINQVPQDQRVAARSYSESQAGGTTAAEASPAVKEEKQADPSPPAASAAAVGEGEESIDGARARLDALKKDTEAEYQLLVKEKDRLAKEKGAQKTREEINAYNKEVEAFNKRAESYEKKHDDLRKRVEGYNALVNEANSKTAAAPKQ
jgi:chromosome segregation ATPase